MTVILSNINKQNPKKIRGQITQAKLDEKTFDTKNTKRHTCLTLVDGLKLCSMLSSKEALKLIN